MALQKQGINVNFSQGLDTKTDPNQVTMGKMLTLENAVFTKGGLLQKRNGFGDLPALPITNTRTLTTLNDSLLALGSDLYAFSSESSQWNNRGDVTQVDLSVQATSRSGDNETQADSATTGLGLTCTAYLRGSALYYNIVDSVTGQATVNPVLISGTNTRPRVFELGIYFIIFYITQNGGTYSLSYIAIPKHNPNSPLPPVVISAQVKNGTDFYEGAVANNRLYVAFNASDVGGAVRVFLLNSNLIGTPALPLITQTGNKISVVADISGVTPNVWVLTYSIGSSNTYATLFDQNLVQLLAPTLVLNGALNQISGTATGNTLTFYIERANNYPGTSIASPYITKNTITSTGTVGIASTIARGVGLASKAFFYNALAYMWVAYGGAFQPTYFLMDANGVVLAKLAYSNGRGLFDFPVPAVSNNSMGLYVSYARKDFLVPLNRAQGVTTAAPFYSQTGTNVVKFSIGLTSPTSAEIAGTLNLSGGFLRMYDGSLPVEQGFHLFPEDIVVTPSIGAGSLTAQTYFYQVTYEWTDNAGNLHRSAGSIPVSGTLAGGQNTNTLQIPTLRITRKTQVRIVIYRWSTAQQTYYQVTSVSNPLLNDPTVDTITYVDLLADSAILGTTILYTTGSVLENIGAPACFSPTLFKSRLFIVDAEDRNLIWYSKQVLENTPVEMTDLQTIFVAPSSSSVGASGPITALSSMDDKLIIFKQNSIYYLTGDGPDATGANNTFSEPVFITSTVGCTNIQSIVFSPSGLMFQSDKGIWLLGRDLGTQYIGAPVEAYNSSKVLSGLTVPGTNQVRFTLDSGQVLMYDYYYSQWGTFINVPAVSSTLYKGLHTYVNSLGQVRQETKGLYLDGTSPVLLKFTTSWFKLTNLQGFQRAYFFYLLSNYLTPHKLSIMTSYDYNPAFTSVATILPTNFNGVYGASPLYGDESPCGGPDNLEQWRVFFIKQKCQAIQISVQESYDVSFNVAAGAGLSISGLNFVIGAKKGYPSLPDAQSAG